MTDIRLLAIDLDDTLVREDNTISDYTRSILKKVQTKGIHIVIATGRMYQSGSQRDFAIG